MTDFVTPSGLRVHLIGDPHLGRKFEVGVPLSRRGEREITQLQDLRDQLNVECDVNIMVGDLFDFPYVSYATVVQAASAYLTAVQLHPETTFVALAGNHDLPRNITQVGAWSVFVGLVENDVAAIRRPQIIKGVACFPWEWDRTASDQVKDLVGEQAYAAVGHWDTVAFDGKDDHLVPVDPLRSAFGDVPIFTGHEHTAGVREIAGYRVTKTGSLQPYSHGEDPDGRIYVTLTRAEALARDDLRDKCVRIALQAGEELPEIDCRALTHIRATAAVEAKEMLSADDFNWSDILARKLAPLHVTVRDFIRERISGDAASE